MTCVRPATFDELSGDRDSVAAASSARVGELLNGEWRLDAILGAGSSAAVYAATHRTGARAAIKLLHAEYTLHEPLRARLKREAQVLRGMNQPGAVRLLEDGACADGELFLAMELLEGETLTCYLTQKEGRLERDQALLIGLLLLDAVVAMHGWGVVHCDLTPDNVFITHSGELKLIDFGISRLLSGAQLEDPAEVGSVFGTPGFMPPEQACGLNQQVDEQSDVWAVGAILFELLTGLPVHFQAHTLAQKLACAISRPAANLGGVVQGASPELQALVDRALAFEKSQRFAQARAMREALLELYLFDCERPAESAIESRLVAPEPRQAAPGAFQRARPDAPARPSAWLWLRAVAGALRALLRRLAAFGGRPGAGAGRRLLSSR